MTWRCRKVLADARIGDGYAVLSARYAIFADMALADLVAGAGAGQRTDIAMVFWLIAGRGRVILADCGFHRNTYRAQFSIREYLRPDRVLRQVGIVPGEVTDIIISHMHWDHVGGVDLFPQARIWMQGAEYRHYSQNGGGEAEGVDPDDLDQLDYCRAAGRLSLVEGTDIEILPGIRAFTGGCHTHASQYLSIAGEPPVVLASDELYFYEELQKGRPSVTFDAADAPANLRAQAHMIALAGTKGHVVPSHDLRQFEKFPAEGRFAIIRGG